MWYKNVVLYYFVCFITKNVCNSTNVTGIENFHFDARKICDTENFCKMPENIICAMRKVNNKSEFKTFSNWCDLFVHNLCKYAENGTEFGIIASESCENYLKHRRINDKATTNVTTTTEFKFLYEVVWTFDGELCPHSCPETYNPQCITVNRGTGKEFKFFTFLNMCYGYLYYCNHHKEFRHVVEDDFGNVREWNSDEDFPNVAKSGLGWSHCGAQRYLNFARFGEVASSMGYYGWLHGKQRYSKILEPYERKPGFG